MCLPFSACTVTHTFYSKHSFSVAYRTQGRSVSSNTTHTGGPEDASPENNGATAPCIFGEAITNNKNAMTKKKKLPTFRTSSTYEWKPEYGTTIKGDSLTVPGESYTIQELFERANAGVPLETLVRINEESDAPDDDLDTFVPEADFDIIDVDNLARESKQTIENAQKALDDNKKESKKAAKRQKSAVEALKDNEATLDSTESTSSENGPENIPPDD